MDRGKSQQGNFRGGIEDDAIGGGEGEGCVKRVDEKWRGVLAGDEKWRRVLAGDEEVGMDSGRNGKDSGDAVRRWERGRRNRRGDVSGRITKVTRGCGIGNWRGKQGICVELSGGN